MPGHSHRVAPAYDPASCPRPAQRGGPPRTGAVSPRSSLAHIALGRSRGRPSSPASSRPSVCAFDCLLPTRPGSRRPQSESSAHAYIWATDTDFPDPAAGFLEPLLRGGTVALPRPSGSRQLLARATARPRPGGTPARVPRVRADLDRRAGGGGAARLRRPHRCGGARGSPGMWANAIARSTFAEAVVTAASVRIADAPSLPRRDTRGRGRRGAVEASER